MMIHTSRPRLAPTVVAALALFSMLLAGCSLSSPTGTQRDVNQVFIFPNTVDQHPLPLWGPDGGLNGPAETGLNLDPAFITDLYSITVDSMIQVQLVTLDKNLNIVPDAASSWDVSSDHLTWTFHLRPNLLWADGRQLTSQDFALGIQHDLDPNLCLDPKSPFNAPNPAGRAPCTPDTVNRANNNPQPQYTYLHYIKGAYDYAHGTLVNGKPLTSISGISTPDAQTIKFQLATPISFFLDQIATAASMPLETSVFAKSGAGYVKDFVNGTGASQSGPFIIKNWFEQSDHSVRDGSKSDEIIFVPNPHWWGKPLSLKEVDMPIIADSNQLYNQYLADGADKIDYAQVPPSDYTFAANLPDFHSVPQLSIDYFGMNFFDPPFDNLQVRQAFDLALNKQSLVDTIFDGAINPTNHIIPYGIPGYDPNLVNPTPDHTVSLTGNQDKAASLIAQVAQGCESDYSHDWCPYIIGIPGGKTAPVSSVGKGGQSCPNFNVGVNSAGTTQKPIVVYAAKNRENRVKMATAAALAWSTVLCLNVPTSNDPGYTPISGGQLFLDLNKVAAKGAPSPEQIWTVGYGVDYVDPQDFTSNQFGLDTINNSANFGFKNPNANDDQSSILALMQQADTLPASTAAEKQARILKYQTIEQKLVDEVAWIPYDQQQALYRLRPYVMNFVLPQSGFLTDADWSDIYIAAHN